MAAKRTQRVGKKAEFRMPELTGNPDAPLFAPSQIRIMGGALDVTLLLGDLRLNAEGVPEMNELCRIRLSPQHAKSLATLLVNNVIEYESEIGPITLPEVVEEGASKKKTA